jgi:hypothetical protein
MPKNYRDTQTGRTHRSKVVGSSINSDYIDSLIEILAGDYDYEIAYIPNGYESRPDLISNVYYGNSDLGWLIMYANGITDPFEELYLNRKLKIPKIS